MTELSLRDALASDLFSQRLSQGSTKFGAGFYFEEGGCWGMAWALYEALKARGLAPQLVFRRTGFVHAWVQLDGLNLDWRGSFQAAPGAEELKDLDALQLVARTEGGKEEEDFWSDVADAEAVLSYAFNKLGFPAPEKQPT